MNNNDLLVTRSAATASIHANATAERRAAAQTRDEAADAASATAAANAKRALRGSGEGTPSQGFGDALREAQARQDTQDAKLDAVRDTRASHGAAERAGQLRDARAAQNERTAQWHRQALELIDRAGQRAAEQRNAASPAASAQGGRVSGDDDADPEASAARKTRGLQASGDRSDAQATTTATVTPTPIPPVDVAAGGNATIAPRTPAGDAQSASDDRTAGVDPDGARDSARNVGSAPRAAALAASGASDAAGDADSSKDAIVAGGTSVAAASSTGSSAAHAAAHAAISARDTSASTPGSAVRDTATASAPSRLTDSLARIADLDDATGGVATPLGDARWGADFSSRVAVHARGAATDIRLSLNPPELGPLQIVLQVVDRQVSAQILSPHAAVREAVAAALPQLRERLDASGMTLGQTQIADAPTLAASYGSDGSVFDSASGNGMDNSAGNSAGSGAQADTRGRGTLQRRPGLTAIAPSHTSASQQLDSAARSVLTSASSGDAPAIDTFI
ncbi:flagellar hook-length control protein FliK [Chitinasiproducens palmae]|uniref:Flagellar hook-length control protein FliK n=1 Tax=Chitinasiproducens palmae TaxID=1770053 RepID=A0A1H2PKU6_9BURK|nr:flagellar hook-length control protein FliK [Chitinasiproducens palmae]SDV46587.1 flagellar hook-length control protein FliK [Chitinasiproducens palmae]